MAVPGSGAAGCPSVDGGVECSIPPPGSGGITLCDHRREDFPRARTLAFGFGSFGGIPLHLAAARAPRKDRSCILPQLSLVHLPKIN